MAHGAKSLGAFWRAAGLQMRKISGHVFEVNAPGARRKDAFAASGRAAPELNAAFNSSPIMIK
jgi:hypothetical protein